MSGDAELDEEKAALNTTCGRAEQDAEKIISDYFEKGTTQVAVRPTSPEISQSAVITSLMDDLSQSIEAFEFDMDKEMGIKRFKQENAISFVSDKDTPKTSIVIRDARGATGKGLPEKPSKTASSWKVAAASRARGALFLMQQCNATPSGDKIKGDILRIYKESEAAIANVDPHSKKKQKQRQKIIKKMDKDIMKALRSSDLSVGSGADVFNLKDLTETDMAQMMLETRDMANLTEKEHPAIVSITDNVAKGTIEQIYTVKTSIPVDPRAEKEKDLKQTSWYKDLKRSSSPLDKMRLKLTDSTMPALTDGMHLQPTQARWIGGIANGYAQTCRFHDAKGKQMKRKSGRAFGFRIFRSASPTHGKGKGEKASVEVHTAENIEYIERLTGDQNHITFNHEDKIVKPFEKAAGDNLDVAPISVSFSKASNLERAANKIANLVGWKKDSCKSGKDRTQGGITEAEFEATKEVLAHKGIISEKAQDKALEVSQIASHGETLAGGRGCSQGAFGTKADNILRGMDPLSTKRIGLKIISRLVNNKEIASLSSVKVSSKEKWRKKSEKVTKHVNKTVKKIYGKFTKMIMDRRAKKGLDQSASKSTKV